MKVADKKLAFQNAATALNTLSLAFTTLADMVTEDPNLNTEAEKPAKKKRRTQAEIKADAEAAKAEAVDEGKAAKADAEAAKADAEAAKADAEAAKAEAAKAEAAKAEAAKAEGKADEANSSQPTISDAEFKVGVRKGLTALKEAFGDVVGREAAMAVLKSKGITKSADTKPDDYEGVLSGLKSALGTANDDDI